MNFIPHHGFSPSAAPGVPLGELRAKAAGVDQRNISNKFARFGRSFEIGGRGPRCRTTIIDSFVHSYLSSLGLLSMPSFFPNATFPCRSGNIQPVVPGS